jgi:hypothetical protein
MPDFISKLQYNTYEKGEFSEQKVRTLAETIALIEVFPWKQERPLKPVGLTGPSVTIRDEDINWLKLGWYYNERFSVYYLDNNNHLYKCYASTIDDACAIVTSFFNSQINLQKFEKCLFNSSNKAHFDTRYFEYRVKVWRALLQIHGIAFYAIIFSYIDILLISRDDHQFKKLIFILFTIFFTLAAIFFNIGWCKMTYSAFINRKNFLQLSKGNPTFSFGFDEHSIHTYKKEDIKEVVIHELGGQRSIRIAFFEINFNNGSVIKFSDALISLSTFKSKFSNNLIKQGKKGLFKIL